MKIFHGWDDAKAMADEFHIAPEKLNGAEILFAGYEAGGYEGDAFVLLRRDGKLYEVNAGHCSCYGLEDQWTEEETSAEAIRTRLASVSYGALREFRSEVRVILEGLS